jgi:hypothetical protein
MGRDFWILIVPVVVLFAGATGCLLARDSVPFAVAFIYLGLHGITFRLRLAPYLHVRRPLSPFSDGGDIWGPPSAMRVAAIGALMVLAGIAGIALEAADWLGIIDLQRYWNGEPR